MDIEKALEEARKSGKMKCPACDEDLFSPMDKLSILLYGWCLDHIEDDSHQEKNIFKIAELL